MNIILHSCSPKANTLDLWHSSSHTAEQTLSEVTILVICDMASAQYVHCDNTSYIKARLRGGSSTFAAFIRSCQICVVKECLTWCVFPQGGSHHCTSEREHVEGTVLIWCTHTQAHAHLHKYTGAVTELWTPEVPVATFLILSSRVNLTLYRVAMVTC